MRKIDRRRFLQAGLAGGAAATVLGDNSEAKAAVHSFQGYPDGMGVLVDLTKCIGCRSCEAACNREQGLPEPEQSFADQSVFATHRRTTEGAYTVVNRYETEGEHPLFRKIQCNHCNEPACLSSCFVNAYTKTPQGAVIYDPTVCVGCRTCMVACPFYVPAYSYSSVTNPVVKKCIFCYDTRLQYGRPPACVEACPQEALTFGKRQQLIKIGHQRIRDNPGSYVDHIYGEHEVGGTAWMYLSSVPFDQVGFDTELGEQPIISYVKEFLTMVPMVLTIWPALFAGFHILAHRREQVAEQGPSGNAKDEEKVS